MPADVRISGAESLADLAKALRAAGESGKGLRRELLRAIREAAKPVKGDVQESWASRMPRRGGLAGRPLRLGARTRMAGARVGVRLVTTNGYDLQSINRGRLRHPVFGRSVYVDQAVPAGVITDPQERAAPDVRAELIEAIDRIRRRVEA